MRCIMLACSELKHRPAWTDIVKTGGLDNLGCLLSSLLNVWHLRLFHSKLGFLSNFGGAPAVGHLLVCCDIEGDE